jgi:hypothetical protein
MIAIAAANFKNLTAWFDAGAVKLSRRGDGLIAILHVVGAVPLKVLISFPGHEDLFLAHARRSNPALAGSPFR